jgi:two-component system chemotaxis response regulator CheB
MKIKVLIVDDSRIFRSSVVEILYGENDIQVIGSVMNGRKAIEFIKSERPHVVTLDVEMPEMDGLETLIQRLNDEDPAHPIGVIMLSSHTKRGADVTIRALEAGAFDFVTKPEGRSLEESFEILRRQLVVKIRHFATRLICSTLAEIPKRTADPGFDSHTSVINAVLIGVSTGGPKALTTILPPLCERVTVPILIVQHMPPDFTQSLAHSLNMKCRYHVSEARDEEPVLENRVYIAPGDRHMLVRRKLDQVLIGINQQPPESGTRPSVDVLFRSGAAVYGDQAAAVILTGMGSDGTQGAAVLKRAGAHIIAQDEKTSVVWGMPGSAAASGNVDQILPLEEIPGAVADLVQKGAKKL